MKPDNKFCEQCSYYDGNDHFKFLEKYGYMGCSGIPHASGEFPYDAKPHCFTDEKLLTKDEIRQKKKEKIIELIKELDPEQAADKILNIYSE